MKRFLKKYKHALLTLYAFIYLPCFSYLEKKVTTDFHAMNSPLDDYLPYLEIFIIPYLIWFLYIALCGVFLCLKSQRQFVKMMILLMLGMTSFLVICYVYPNGLYDFRVPTEGDSFFGKLIKILHSADTSTNVFPSIHVYNSLCIHIAISKYSDFKHSWVKPASFTLCVLICMSTVFLKQHALIDVIGGIVMIIPFFHLVYKSKFSEFIDKHTWADLKSYEG